MSLRKQPAIVENKRTGDNLLSGRLVMLTRTPDPSLCRQKSSASRSIRGKAGIWGTVREISAHLLACLDKIWAWLSFRNHASPSAVSSRIAGNSPAPPAGYEVIGLHLLHCWYIGGAAGCSQVPDNIPSIRHRAGF